MTIRLSPPRAMFLLLLSLSLFGCNHTDCNAVRNTTINSTKWDALLKLCSECLTAEEMKTLQAQKQLYERANLQWLLGEQTVQEALNAATVSSNNDVSEILKNMPSQGQMSSEGASSQGAFGPWVIPESVLFLYADLHDDQGSIVHVPSATAFILCVPHRKDGTQMQNSFVRFLVTARHVLDPEWAHCQGKNPTSITIRMNKRAGGVGYETVLLEVNHKRRFLTPSDDTSDVAVLFLDRTLIPNLDTYKFFDIPFRLMPTQAETEAFHKSQKIMTAGLQPQFPGERENLPIFRDGLLSNTPTEAVNVSCGGSKTTPLHTWFLTAMIPKGVSGAPVFSIVNRGPGAPLPVLVGIQSIAWPDQGVAGMTPSPVLADFVHDLLDKAHFDVDFYRGPEKRSCGGQ
jgi:hypothetical protein